MPCVSAYVTRFGRKNEQSLGNFDPIARHPPASYNFRIDGFLEHHRDTIRRDRNESTIFGNPKGNLKIQKMESPYHFYVIFVCCISIVKRTYRQTLRNSFTKRQPSKSSKMPRRSREGLHGNRSRGPERLRASEKSIGSIEEETRVP